MAKNVPQEPAVELDPGADAVEAYKYAQARYLEARKTWESEGKPYTVWLANGVESQSPLWKVMIEAETVAARLRDKLATKKAVGRPVGAQSAPDRTKAAGRPAPLRAVS